MWQGQLSYEYTTAKFVAGGLLDISAYEINTRTNDENDGVLKFGLGVAVGATPGQTIKLPVAASAAAQFDGVTVNGFTVQEDLSGNVAIKHQAAVGCLKWGKIGVRVASDVTSINYDDNLYWVNQGDDAGKFSNKATNTIGANTVNNVRLYCGKFIGGIDSANGLAPVEFYNQDQALPISGT